MNLETKLSKIKLLLHPREILTVDDSHRGLAIECKEGVLWVTSSAESGDHILFSGKKYIAKNHGRVVIEAIDDACVDIEQP
jgi:hypothetical protein